MPPLATVIAKQLLDGLLRHADPDAARQSQRFFKEPIAHLGVNAPTMRRLALEVHAGVKTMCSPTDALDVCGRLLADARNEVKITVLLFLARFAKQLDDEIFQVAQHWIEAGLCNSWAVIDELCGDILGPLLMRGPAWFSAMQTWHGSPNMWLRRAAAVALVKPARRGLILDKVYATAGKLLNDPEDLVQKAVGWLLREAGKTDMDRLEAYLRKNGRRCARTTLRYAIERFPERIRRELLTSTK